MLFIGRSGELNATARETQRGGAATQEKKDLAQRNAEGAEKRQKDFNNGFNGWNSVHRSQREIKRQDAENAKTQGKRGINLELKNPGMTRRFFDRINRVDRIRR
jgi:hypothetical protein